MLYRNIRKLSKHLKAGILSVTYCTFLIDIINIANIIVFHARLNFCSDRINPISEGGGLIQPPPTKYRFKSGYLGARTPQTHWLFLNMYEKWYPNVFGVISLRGPPRGPTFFLAPPEKMLKSTVFELEQWFLHQNGPFFHQEFNGKGLWVLGSQFCTKKLKNISEFQNSWNFWIFGSWTQPGAWHMILPFWSWNLSDTIHVRSHTKFQIIWAINTAFTRGQSNVEMGPPQY